MVNFKPWIYGVYGQLKKKNREGALSAAGADLNQEGGKYTPEGARSKRTHETQRKRGVGTEH